MLISYHGINLIKSFESCRLKAFKPTPKDVWTIGWGRTKGVFSWSTCSQPTADLWLSQDVAAFAASVNKFIGNAPTTQFQFDAMVSLAYNIGIGAFFTSTVLRDHKAKLYSAAASAFLLFNKQKGVVVAGLERRREAESALYLENV